MARISMIVAGWLYIVPQGSVTVHANMIERAEHSIATTGWPAAQT